MRILAVLFFFSTLASPSTFAAGALGWENGNAGDTYAAEFRLTGKDIVQRLGLLRIGDQPAYDTAALRAALNAKVESAPAVYLNGAEVDAANYPAKGLIQVNRARWDFLRRSTETRARWRVVLHEYLWMSGVDDSDFVKSDELIGYLNPRNYSPNIWWNPVNPVNVLMAGLVFKPQDCAFANLDLNLNAAAESFALETTGADCGEHYRRLQVVKSAGLTPASSAVRGMFHRFDLMVFDRNGTKLGAAGFEPAWGECLLPEDGTCRASGKIIIGGVEVVFWYLREKN